MHKSVFALFAIAAAVIAAPAGAQLRAPDSGFYGGLGAGRTDSDLAGASEKRDTAWKVFGGYQFNKYFALEGGYVDLGRASIPGTAFDSTVWQGSAVGSLPLADQFALTGKLGIAQVNTDVSNRGTNHHTDPTYGLGLRYDFTRQFGIRGEWERFRVSGSPVAGTSDTDLYSINAVLRFQ